MLFKTQTTKIIFALFALVSISACNKFGSVELKTDKQKISYTIGQQIGSSFKQQGLDVDVDVLTASIKEVLKGDKSRMTDQEMQQTMMSMREAMMKKSDEEAKGNKEKGDKFLEENKKKEGVKVTASGLQYIMTAEGKGNAPKETDTVKVHYKGTLIDGTEFDSSYTRNEPAVFPVNGVIKGWTEALKMMKPGGKATLVIPSDLAYGPMGRPGIPPNSVLQFEVELIEIVKPEPKKK
ncbi:MAG: FKBP-type peptidyl-prolyl cis-trans isomerase [Bdellovibrionales bacterium]